MLRKMMVALVALASLSSAAFARSDGTGFETTSCEYPADMPLPGSGINRRVPQEYPTIQAAVDAAVPGDSILIDSGVYPETVRVRKDALRIRGLDRNNVILDGGMTDTSPGKSYGIWVENADYVVVENMTAHNYGHTAFFWHHAHGYMGRYLTTYNNGQYGIYAFDARCGQFDHSYGSGNADSAFYIGECFPCDAVITKVVSEENGLGYSGTNAGGNLLLKDSIYRNNGLGIVPNSLLGEDRPPQRGLTIKNNLVENNNNKTAPGSGLTGAYWGGGIILAGGQGNIVAGNDVVGHELAGILTSPLPEAVAAWIPAGNTIWGNTVSHDAEAYPDSLDLIQAAASGPNNCWSYNTVGTTAPLVLQELWSCEQTMTPPGGDPRVELALVLGQVGANGRAPEPAWNYPFTAGPQEQQPDDNGNSSYLDDGAIDEWIPAVL